MMEMARVTTLRQRRLEACDKFAARCLAVTRFALCFRLKQGRADSRRMETYFEDH